MTMITNPIARVTAFVIGFVLIASAFTPLAQAANYPLEGKQYVLAGAGVTSSATTMQLTSFTTPDGAPVTMTLIGALGYGTIEPQTSAKVENITFTGVTQNVNGTATLTGVTRGIAFTYPYAATASLRQSHSGGATFIITNTPNWYFNEFGMVNNDSAVTGNWTFPTPLANANAATKQYVDGLVSGGSVTNVAVTVPGTAGETVASGNILYFKPADGRWYKAAITDGNASTTELGISQGAGTAGNAVSGGVALQGLDVTQTGLSTGSTYYVGATAGTISSVKSGRVLGVARGVTSFYLDTNINGIPRWSGLNFTVPSVQGASSTALTTDGAGNLTWGGFNYQLRASSSPIYSTTNASTTIFTAALPTTVMTAGSIIHVSLPAFSVYNGTASTGFLFIEAGYGNGTTSINVPNLGINSNTSAFHGDLEFSIQNINSASQRNILSANIASTSPNSALASVISSIATSSTAVSTVGTQTLNIIVKVVTGSIENFTGYASILP